MEETLLMYINNSSFLFDQNHLIVSEASFFISSLVFFPNPASDNIHRVECSCFLVCATVLFT